VRAEGGAKGGPAGQDVRGVRAVVRLAQELGARLGRGEVLFGTVPGGEGEGVISTERFVRQRRVAGPRSLPNKK
jgi:hypothetical protein